MASYQAIQGVTEAVVALLKSRFEEEGYAPLGLTYAVYQASNFNQPMIRGVSLFLYRVYPNGSHRTPAGRFASNGERFQTRLPLDLHFFITAWAQDASLQHEITGLAMRTLEDNPILPAGLLNAVVSDVFLPDETVELGLAELTNEDMLRIWETITEDRYQLSVPYYARNVQIDSDRIASGGTRISERRLDLGSGTSARKAGERSQ